MATTVFISHSCKDHEERPPNGLTPAQVAARAERLAFARKLRERLYAALSQDTRCRVFLDLRALKPGDVWRDGLHTALRSCSGGVVLLSPESLESGWVLKEATILSWRVFSGERLRVVPVVVGVSDEDLERRGFGALDLDQIQWVKLKNVTEAEIGRAVQETLAALEPVLVHPAATATKLTRTELWIDEFAEKLSRVMPQPASNRYWHYLTQMCDALAIAHEDRGRFDDDPLVNLATHVLIAKDEQIVRFLNQAGTPNEPQREELSSAVAPLWVDPTPASRLAAGRPGVIAIDAVETSSVREYVLRAFCNRIEPDRIFEPTDVTAGSDADVIATIERTLSSILPIEDRQETDRYVRENGAVFVILGPGSTRPTVLDAMTAKYPQLTFVVAAGPKPREKLGGWWDRALFLYPLLQPHREPAASRYRNRLLRFAKGA